MDEVSINELTKEIDNESKKEISFEEALANIQNETIFLESQARLIKARTAHTLAIREYDAMTQTA